MNAHVKTILTLLGLFWFFVLVWFVPVILPLIGAGTILVAFYMSIYQYYEYSDGRGDMDE